MEGKFQIYSWIGFIPLSQKNIIEDDFQLFFIQPSIVDVKIKYQPHLLPQFIFLGSKLILTESQLPKQFGLTNIHSMNTKEIFLVTFTLSIYAGLTFWQPCLTTFCKNTNFPDWLNKIVYSIPIPFAEKFLIAFLVMFPIVFFSESYIPILVTFALVPLITAITKYIPRFELTTAFAQGFLFEYVFILVTLLTSSGAIYLVRLMIQRLVSRN